MRSQVNKSSLTPRRPRFFARFGFVFGEWAPLADALKQHGQVGTVLKFVESDYGTRYIVEGRLDTPDGRDPHVRTVWMIEKDGVRPRLITAYPCEDENDEGT